MNFIYAVNNESVLSAAVLDRCELRNILKDPGKLPAVSSITGPGGRCVLFGDVPVSSLRYQPEAQQWIESYNKKYYIGLSLESPPVASELARKKQLAGHMVDLGNGEKWLIPVARKFAEGCGLPVSLAIGSKGEIIIDPLPEYAEFSRRAEMYYNDTLRKWDWLDGECEMDGRHIMLLAIEAIMWNYHLSFEEIRLLALITSKNLHPICEATIDRPTVEEVAKQILMDKKKIEAATTQDG